MFLPFQLKRLIERLQPDIVHCRNWNSWPDTFAANLLGSGTRKLLWSFHGFGDGDSFPWRRRVASRCLASGTDRLAAVCRHSAELFAARTGIASRRFEILSNGVDTRRFAPARDRLARKAELGIPARNLLMLTVANLTPIKDHGSLVKAISRLAPINGLPIQFMLLGEGPMRTALQAQIEALGLNNAIVLGGTTDRVADYLAASDAFILPSKLEGMSNAILEAMASGLPVVAYAVGGNPELVVNGETGFLCAPGDIAGLSGAIRQLAANADLRQRMGCAARRRAETLFSIDAMIAAYAGFYRRAAGIK